MTPAELKAERAALGLSQQKLADALGVTARAIKHWEAGTRRVPEWLTHALRGLSSHPT